jgi:acetylornithine/succinyldiaminopimelate/putrescine aminotransferase
MGTFSNLIRHNIRIRTNDRYHLHCSEAKVAATQVRINNIELSLEDLLGTDYVEAVCEAQAFITGESQADYLNSAREKVAFFPKAYQDRLDQLLDCVGERVVGGLADSSVGSSTAAFNKATHRAMAPLAATGFYRMGEDGRLYVITKSEHYHASLGHDFPGYRLIKQAQRLGITNVTHNNTRGHITRLAERELVRAANGLPKGNEAALDQISASTEPHVLNRVINLETGSLAVEAALKMMLARFYRVDDTYAVPEYTGRMPVFLVIADREGGKKANYHGTTILTQVLRGMWPEFGADLADRGLYRVQPVRINDIADFGAALEQWDQAPFKVAGFFHEIVLMNYGAIRLTPEYLHAAYDLCHTHDVPVVADEIQSCAWSPELFLFREYGLDPDFVSVGKGFPGGQYPASRILLSARYDTLNQFGALVTNGQEELAALAYLVTMTFVEANREYVGALGNYYMDRLNDLAAKFPKLIERTEGYRHLGSLLFRSADSAVAFMKIMNRAGYDVSAQTYKAECPPAILTKVPLISSYKMIDQFTGKMAQALSELLA